MKFSELQRKLERGWYIDRTSSHHNYIHKEKPGIIISVGKHGTKEVPKGTAIKILKTEG